MNLLIGGVQYIDEGMAVEGCGWEYRECRKVV